MPFISSLAALTALSRFLNKANAATEVKLNSSLFRSLPSAIRMPGKGSFIVGDVFAVYRGHRHGPRQP